MIHNIDGAFSGVYTAKLSAICMFLVIANQLFFYILSVFLTTPLLRGAASFEIERVLFYHLAISSENAFYSKHACQTKRLF